MAQAFGHASIEPAFAAIERERGLAIKKRGDPAGEHGNAGGKLATGRGRIVRRQIVQACEQQVIGGKIGAERGKGAIEAAQCGDNGLAQGHIIDPAFGLQRAPLRQWQRSTCAEQRGRLAYGLFKRQVFKARERVHRNRAVERPERGDGLRGNIDQHGQFCAGFAVIDHGGGMARNIGGECSGFGVHRISPSVRKRGRACRHGAGGR